MNSEILVSVIVPVYNVERYLNECLESILQQTHINLQILLVDDGSKDSSSAICDSFAALDKRVEVFHQENAGVSSARNTGIEHAKGEWVVFVDSDDIIKRDYVSNLLSTAIFHSSDMVVSGLVYWNQKTGEKANKNYSDVSYRAEDCVKAFCVENLHQNGGPFSKIFKTKIVQDFRIRFNQNLQYAEDLDFVMKYAIHAECISFIQNVDYIYRLSGISLSSKKLSYETECLCLQEMQKRYEEVCARFAFADLTILKASLLQYFGRVVKSILCLSVGKTEKRIKLRKLSRECSCYFSESEYSEYKPYCIYEKIILRLLYHNCPNLMIVFNNVYKMMLRQK